MKSEPGARPVSGRGQTLGEEIANAITHGVGLLASVVLAPFIILTAQRSLDLARVVAASLYVATLVLLYGASTLYHALPASATPRAKAVLQRLDHSAIYLLIAGTYTPVLMIGLRGAWGWSLMGVIWGLALLGILLKSVFGAGRFNGLSTAVYLGMGWLAIVAIRPILTHLSTGAILWLAAGGLAYTGGVVFYLRDRRRYHHAIWHLFVLGGSACHAWAVLAYVLPAASAVGT